MRFNPYLWPEGGGGMKDETGLALYQRAGELNMPVGVMCFKGLRLHFEEIKSLLQCSPQTKVQIRRNIYVETNYSYIHVWSIEYDQRDARFVRKNV